MKNSVQGNADQSSEVPITTRRTNNPPAISRTLGRIVETSRSKSQRILTARYGAAKMIDYNSNFRRILEDKQPLLTFNWVFPPGTKILGLGLPDVGGWSYIFHVENIGGKKSGEAMVEFVTDVRPGAKAVYKIVSAMTHKIPPLAPKETFEVSGVLALSGFPPQSVSGLAQNTAFNELPLFYWLISGELNDGKILSFYPRLEFETNVPQTGVVNFAEPTLSLSAPLLPTFSMQGKTVDLRFNVKNMGKASSGSGAKINVNVKSSPNSLFPCQGSALISIPPIAAGETKTNLSANVDINGLPLDQLGEITFRSHPIISASITGAKTTGNQFVSELDYFAWIGDKKEL